MYRSAQPSPAYDPGEIGYPRRLLLVTLGKSSPGDRDVSPSTLLTPLPLQVRVPEMAPALPGDQGGGIYRLGSWSQQGGIVEPKLPASGVNRYYFRGEAREPRIQPALLSVSAPHSLQKPVASSNERNLTIIFQSHTNKTILLQSTTFFRPSQPAQGPKPARYPSIAGLAPASFCLSLCVATSYEALSPRGLGTPWRLMLWSRKWRRRWRRATMRKLYPRRSQRPRSMPVAERASRRP